MLDTVDLTSYYPGYDDYCENDDIVHDEYEYDLYLADVYHDEMMIRKEQQKMERKVIDLNNTNMTLDEIMKLADYVWKEDKLISTEQLEGE